jgi:hypothetical protein
MTELEKLRAENKYLRDLLERWVRQYGYREPWVVPANIGPYGRIVNKENTKTV